MESEIWKDAKGYQGDYSISTMGVIKSMKSGKERILKLNLVSGYYQVCLYLNGKPKNKNIHQLMAETFLGHNPCGFKLVVDHIDTNKLNNCLSNLRIVTSRTNSNRKHLKSTSNFTGVSWHKTTKKWYSSIVIDGKKIHLGYFNNEEDASKYYENALNNHLLRIPIEAKKTNFTSKYKGVSWQKGVNKWYSYIRINGKKKNLGLFNSEIEAYNANQKFANDIIQQHRI